MTRYGTNTNVKDTWSTDDDGNIRLSSSKDFKSLGIQDADTFAAVNINGSVVLVKIDMVLK